MTPIQLFAWTVLALSLVSSGLSAQEKQSDFKVPNDITFRTADIMSEGTRMSAEVFAPKEPAEGKLPTIVMCHGFRYDCRGRSRRTRHEGSGKELASQRLTAPRLPPEVPT